ncbi:hypothetical protein SAMN05192552_103115 [Natrinema hispanicum]|uniref:Uncharacterized protein n=1 Tax=Natrinema hispanicum TaxID=392421 RepID=A0A1G6VRW4_9EURY|nr:hypothetical protein SAMN05192552_103115 [Natrinema hispanicum]
MAVAEDGIFQTCTISCSHVTCLDMSNTLNSRLIR